MLAARLAMLSLSLTLAACGPQPAGPATTDHPATTGGTIPATDALPGTTPGDPTTTSDPSSTSTSSTSGTSSTTTMSVDSTTATSADSTTGDPEIYPCQSANRCEENEHCTPEARQNADIAGETPLGPFKGTFAFASAAIAFGDLGNVYVLPEYMTDLCAAAPMLVIQLGYTQGQGGTFEAPVAIDDGQGQLVQTTATVHVGACCNIMWFCDCESPSPYELEITVTGDGWSLAGTARPNCCRSYSIDEAA
jgi:hypothetical protein